MSHGYAKTREQVSFIETSGSVANKSTLSFNHAQSNSTPGILAQTIENSFVKNAPTISSDYIVEKIPTIIKDSALGSTGANGEDKLCCCELSNGNICVVYSVSTSLFFTIYQQSDWTAAVSETTIASGGTDLSNMTVRAMGDEFVVAWEDGGVIAIEIFSNAGVSQHGPSTPTSGNTACDELDIAVYPDNSGFILVYEGTSQDLYYEVFDSNLSSQSWAEANNAATVAGLCCTILEDETLVIGYNDVSTFKVRTYDASNKSSLSAGVSDTSIEASQAAGTKYSMLPINSDSFVFVGASGGGDLVIFYYKISGSSIYDCGRSSIDGGVGDRTVRCMAWNDLNHALTFQDIAGWSATGILYGKGQPIKGGGNFTLGMPAGDFDGYGCVTGASGGCFFITYRNLADDKPYFFVMRAMHCQIEIDDSNNVTLTNYMGETLTFKLTYTG